MATLRVRIRPRSRLKVSTSTSSHVFTKIEVESIKKSVNQLLPSLKLNSDDVAKAISGDKVDKLDKYLDIDILELARKEGIPSIFFHLVIAEFAETAKLSEGSKSFLAKAKRRMNELDGNIYASVKTEKLDKTEKILFDAANRAFKKNGKFNSQSSSASDWHSLKKSEKEHKVKIRLRSFVHGARKSIPYGKFSSVGSLLICNLTESHLSKLQKEELDVLEKEFGMRQSVKPYSVCWKIKPSKKYFTSKSSVYGKLEPLINVILKLDPRALIRKVGKFLKVVSPKLKSPRLDDAFETVGKKCGAYWKGRDGDNDEILVWQTLHNLEMKAASTVNRRKLRIR